MFALAAPNDDGPPQTYGHSPSAAARIYVANVSVRREGYTYFLAKPWAGPSSLCGVWLVAPPVAVESVAFRRLCGTGLSAGE